MSITSRLLGASLALAIFAAPSCSSGSGSVTITAFDLNGEWQLQLRVTQATPNCGLVVGSTQDFSATVVHDRPNRVLSIAISPTEMLAGTTNGDTAVLSGQISDATSTTAYNISFSFNATTLQGSGSFTETEAGETCQWSATLTGTMTSSGGGLQSYFSGLSADGGTASVRAGTAPAAGSGPMISTAGSSAVIAGGTSTVAISSGASFDTLLVFVEGVAGYWEVAFGAGRSSASILIQLGQAIPAAQFRCVYAGVLNGVVGAYDIVDITRTNVGTGDLQINLSWDSDSDLDLYLVEPDGSEIYYADQTSPNGGELDLDSNAACDPGIANENITYQGVTPPRGNYTVRVNHWENCSNRTSNFVVRVNIVGQTPVVRTGSFSGPGVGGGSGAGQVVYQFTLQ